MNEVMIGFILGLAFFMVFREPVTLVQEVEMGQAVCEKNDGLSSIQYHAIGVVDEFRCADGAVFDHGRVRGDQP